MTALMAGRSSAVARRSPGGPGRAVRWCWCHRPTLWNWVCLCEGRVLRRLQYSCHLRFALALLGMFGWRALPARPDRARDAEILTPQPGRRPAGSCTIAAQRLWL